MFRVYAQHYHGYGESMIDYDYKNERMGIGIAMNDFYDARPIAQLPKETS